MERFSYCPTDRFRASWAGDWFICPRLVCCRRLLRIPSGYSWLCNHQYNGGLLHRALHRYPDYLLDEHIRGEEVPHLLVTCVRCHWGSVQCVKNSKWENIRIRSARIRFIQQDSYEYHVCIYLWIKFCSIGRYNISRCSILWEVKYFK